MGNLKRKAETEAALSLAKELCKEDADQEMRRYGLVPPSNSLDPLNPPLDWEEYNMMERDRGKYLLYSTAIKQAFEDHVPTWTKENDSGSAVVECLVVGCGFGRLILYCLESASLCDVSVHVTAVDSNPLAVSYCRKWFSKYCQETNDAASSAARQRRVSVDVLDSLTLLPYRELNDFPPHLRKMKDGVNLFVCELLGSFADNEFHSEVMSEVIRHFLGPGGIFIPQNYTTYVAPLFSPSTHSYFNQPSSSNPVADGGKEDGESVTRSPKRPKQKHPDAGHVGSFPLDGVLLSEPQVAYSCESDALCETLETQDDVVFDVSLQEGQEGGDVVVHALAGWFTSTLYGDIAIDSRLETRNCFHWETWFFPMKKPVVVKRKENCDAKVLCSVRRHFEALNKPQHLNSSTTSAGAGTADAFFLWYEWKCWEMSQTKAEVEWQNKGGSVQVIELARPTVSKGILETINAQARE